MLLSVTSLLHSSFFFQLFKLEPKWPQFHSVHVWNNGGKQCLCVFCEDMIHPATWVDGLSTGFARSQTATTVGLFTTANSPIRPEVHLQFSLRITWAASKCPEYQHECPQLTSSHSVLSLFLSGFQLNWTFEVLFSLHSDSWGGVTVLFHYSSLHACPWHMTKAQK